MEKIVERKIKGITAKHCTRCGDCCRYTGVMIEDKAKKLAVAKGVKKAKAVEKEDSKGFVINALASAKNPKKPLVIEVSDASPFFPLQLPNGFFLNVPERDLLFFGGKECPFLEESQRCGIHCRDAFPKACALYPAKIDEGKKTIFLNCDCEMVKDNRSRKGLLKEIKKAAGRKFKVKVSNSSL